ncbi:MAG: 2-C-methyl-D-erythritol 4-phosphate cytidylyltransferase [Chloroflexota bacterium]|nr:2-C-methyl-D-erythritol 4-phosphate cytidylyltransferase [Chloroflexota bacterium]
MVAAGSSRRMAGIDKVLAPIGDRPLLAWTLAAVAAAPEIERIALVVSAQALPAIRAADWLPAKVAGVVTGGARRQESVAAGLAALDTLGVPAGAANSTGSSADRVVLVHDGGRPVVSATLVGAVAHAAAAHGAAIPVVPIVETVKRIDDDRVGATVERSGLAVAQTPQGARRSLLGVALERFPANGPRTFTDEAALLEACRIPVHAIPGEPMNLKVTTADDLDRAELALLGRSGPRVGYGDDSHPFGPGEPLELGGITIDGAPRLHGHSDGDVVLHAVADALLGAAGLDDLGRLFPAGPATPRGIASRELLGDVVRRLAAVGLRPAQLDLTVVAARPRLGDRLGSMRAAIAGLLELPVERINVKASTGNLAGAEGAGRAIAARAVAVVEPIR